MSNEPTPQDVQDEAELKVKPTDEPGDEKLDNVVGGIMVSRRKRRRCLVRLGASWQQC